MLVELVRLAVVIAFTVVGNDVAKRMVDDPASGRVILGAVLGSMFGYVVGGVLGRSTETLLGSAERRATNVSVADVVAGAIGVAGGLLIAGLFAWPLIFLPSQTAGLVVLGLLLVVTGALGHRIAMARRDDVLQLFGLTWRARATDVKILDTSAILDPRLLDCVRAGFLRGPILLPQFVLEEVQSIADSGDPGRRARGRRGLETLGALRREHLADVRVETDRMYPEFSEVDAKVVALARERGGGIVTNDIPLARVAELQGIEVLSLIALAEAMKPPVLPGEELSVLVQKEGREPGQGVGYLEDGTMVVVEDGRDRLGAEVHVSVTSILQTSGGRMIFSRPAEPEAESPPGGSPCSEEPEGPETAGSS